MRHIFGIALLLGVLLAAPLGAPSAYYAITPGGAYQIGPRLKIGDDHRRQMGRSAFTAVYAQPATWLEVARVKAFGQAELVPADDVRPPGTSQQQVNETNKRLIDESKPVAAIVGLRAAGFDAGVTGHGAQVESVLPGSPADGVLQKDDVIVAVDDQPIETTATLIGRVRAVGVGDELRLTVARGDQPQEVALRTMSSPTEPGRPIIGVTISTYQFDVKLPFPVEVDTADVGGPSAGLMLALGILDAVTDGDLMRGYYVAGTGTIADDGTVGPISGTAEKVVAAEKDGAQIFLVPRANYDDAQKWKTSLRIEPVDRFEDAVRFLCTVEPAANAAPDPPAPCR